MKAERNIEFIRLGQTYIETKDESLMDRLSEIASSIENISLPLIIENLKTAVKEGTENAVCHDINTINDDKTLEAFHKYAGSVKAFTNELDLPSVFNALILTNSIFSYEQVTEAALNVAKEYIKKIVTETQCNATTANSLATDIIFYVCELSYSMHHRVEFETYNIATEKLSEQLMDLMSADIERDEYIEQRSLLYKTLEAIHSEYIQKVYKFDQSAQLAKEWVGELFPHETFTIFPALKKASLNEFELLDSIIPKKYIIPNNKLTNMLTKERVDLDMELGIVVNEKKQVITKVTLNYDDDNITIYDHNKKFTAYDRSVYNAVCSLFEAGNRNFTPDQVYRCMNGLDDSQFVSTQSVGAITKSLDKARRTLVKIDYEDEAKLYKNDDEKKSETYKFIMEDYILTAKKLTLIAGKKEVVGYKLSSKPILYEYAQFTHQVISVPFKLLNTKDVIKSTPEVIVIREYLIRRIEVMKNNKKQSNKILLTKIYDEIGQPEPTKQKAGKIKDSIEKLLGKFKDEKYIKGFEFYKEGRSFKGIEIFY